MSKFRVAAIQMPTVENKMDNVKAVRHYLEEIRDQKIDFVVLPEMFCCPYETGKFPEYAEEEGGPVWTALSAYAKEYNTYLVAGSMPEKDEEGHVYNTCYIFDRNGMQIGRHRKTHLFDIDVKGFKQRNIEKPSNEMVIKGPHEAFVENIRTNTSLIRKIINNENLIIENISIGKITKTKCAVCYMQNIANPDLINEVKYRLNNLEVDSLLSAGELEQLIVDSNDLGIPQVLSTERPDKVSKFLLGGRVAIIINGTPYGLIVPAVLIDFLSSSEDSNLKVDFGNFLRVLRIIAAFLTLLLPGLYIAITSFHQEILPTSLLFSILASRANVPFPIIAEILLMEISFELIREAGLRVPSAIGSTIGIVGALVLGQAAVSAGIVSPILIIIVAITGIASFSIPDFSFGFHLRYFRFFFILMGYMAGFLGIAVGLFVYISLLCNQKSFGVSYTAPFAPSTKKNGNGYMLPPIWKREYRAPYTAHIKEKSQEKISMKWKFNSEKGDNR